MHCGGGVERGVIVRRGTFTTSQSRWGRIAVARCMKGVGCALCVRDVYYHLVTSS